MIDKKILYLFVMIPFLGFFSCNTVNNVSSNFMDTAPYIDGRLDDWEGSCTLDKTSKLCYAVGHDDHNVYVALEVGDKLVQRKIMLFGLTLWIDTTGGKQKMKGVRFPIPFDNQRNDEIADNVRSNLPPRTQRALPETRRRILKPAILDQMMLLGFHNKEQQLVSVAEDTGIEIRIKRQKPVGIIYEAQLPYKMVYTDEPSEKISLSLGFITGSLELPDEMSGLRSPGMNPGGGRYPGGGRMSGREGAQSGQSPDLEELQKSTKLWLRDIPMLTKPE